MAVKWLKVQSGRYPVYHSECGVVMLKCIRHGTPLDGRVYQHMYAIEFFDGGWRRTVNKKSGKVQLYTLRGAKERGKRYA